MINSSVLDVIIGLVFIYFLYSILATTIQEMLVAISKTRARMLKRAIERMLTDNFYYQIGEKKIYFKDYPYLYRFISIVLYFMPFLSKLSCQKYNLSNEFYQQPSITYLGLSVWSKIPSYVSPQNFSKTMIDLLKEKGIDGGNTDIEKIYFVLNCKDKEIKGLSVDPQTSKFLKSLIDDAQNDIGEFKLLLEKWFEETMLRLSGVYKRRVQLNLMFIGLVFAILFNIDTIQIANTLSKSPEARDQLVNLSLEYLKYNEKDSLSNKSVEFKIDSTIIETIKNLEKEMNTPNNLVAIGWGEASFEKTNTKQVISNIKSMPILKKLLGFLLTAFAISFGAPFWFDLLNKLVKLRTAGKLDKK